jgi:hypothetical protein
VEKDVYRKRLSRARIPRDKPASAKIVSFPGKSSDFRSRRARMRAGRREIEAEWKSNQKWQKAVPPNDWLKEPGKAGDCQPEEEERR